MAELIIHQEQDLMLLDHYAIDIEAARIDPNDAPAVRPGVVLPLSQSVGTVW